MYLNILGLLFLLGLSGFFSSSELAFIVSNKIKIELKARKNKLAPKNAMFFVHNPQLFYSTILVSNNIINIAYASVITVFLSSFFELGEFSILIISTFSLLLFGELIPKYIATEMPNQLIMFTINPIRLITILLYPVVKFTSKISDMFSRSADLTEDMKKMLFEKDELNRLVEEGVDLGSVQEDELDVVKKVLELGDQKVYEAMTPRTDIVGVEINSTLNNAIDAFIESGYSKLPVYHDSMDKIIGIIFVNDMYKSPENLQNIIREVIFVPETKKSMDMLNEMLEKNISIAVVVDEFGGTAGIITVEDILEEIFGEIRDEYDIEEEIYKKIDKNTYIISGKVEVDQLNEVFDLAIPESDYETIAGFITNKIGRIPIQNETLHLDHFRVVILRADKTRIDLIKLIVDEERLEEIKEEID